MNPKKAVVSFLLSIGFIFGFIIGAKNGYNLIMNVILGLFYVCLMGIVLLLAEIIGHYP